MAKTSFDESDISLGHINALFIAPPHTAGSLKACIVKVEGLVTPGHALYKDMELFQDTVECRASGSCCQSFIQMKNRIVTSYLNKNLQSSLMSNTDIGTASQQRFACNNGKKATQLKPPFISLQTFTQSRTLQTQCQKSGLLLQSQKANITKFCSPKKRTLQSFVV